MTELQHHTRSIRIAPRKLRLVVDKMRHMPVEKALGMLPLIPKRGALHVQKSLKAAVEAAKDKDLNVDTLMIQRIWADEGTSMKRARGHRHNSGASIMKKYSHLTIVLKGETGRAKKVVKPAKAETETVEEAN